MGPGKIDCGGGGNSRSGGSFGALPSVTAHMVQRSADVADGAAREGGEVTDLAMISIPYTLVAC